MSWAGNIAEFGPAPLAVDVYWDSYPGKKAHIWDLWNQSGWMQVSRVTLETPLDFFSETIVSFCNDNGRIIQNWLGERIFDMRAGVPTYMHHAAPEELEDASDALYWDFLGRCDRKTLRGLNRRENEAIITLRRKEADCSRGLLDIQAHVAKLRRERRHPDCSEQRRQAIEVDIKKIEAYRPRLIQAMATVQESQRHEQAQFEMDSMEGIKTHGRIETLYTVYWTMVSRKTPPPVNISLWTEERFLGNLNVGTKWKAQMDAMSSTKKPVRKVSAIDFSELDKKRSKVSIERPIIIDKPEEKLASSAKQKPITSAWDHYLKKQRDRQTRQQLSIILDKHGTLSEFKYVHAFLKGKAGRDLKTGLIYLAKHGFMSTQSAVDLYKILTALNEMDKG